MWAVANPIMVLHYQSIISGREMWIFYSIYSCCLMVPEFAYLAYDEIDSKQKKKRF